MSQSMSAKLKPVLALLGAQTTLVLATTGEDGLARSTPLFYIHDDDLRLYWFSSRSTLHSRNCVRQSHVSVSVSTAALTWQQIQGVQMQGVVSIIPSGARRKALTAAYIERFALGNLFSLAIRSASLYCFQPAWLRYIDNTRRFGYKFELDFPPEAR